MPANPHVCAAEAPTFNLPGIQFTGLASPSRGARESAVWMVSIDPQTPGARHQLTREEVFVVLEGRARASIGNSDYEVATGDALIVPPGTDFALSNPFDAAFRAVAVLPVGGLARMGEELFTPPWAR